MKGFRPKLERRSALEWSVRVLLALAVGTLGYGAVMHALAQSLSAKQIERRPDIAARDARALARLARAQMISYVSRQAQARELRSSGASAEVTEAAARAQEALRRDPTAVPAAGTLGLAAELRGDTASARRWFAYSERLSRRDLATQLWLIEDAVRRDDIAGALRHYDVALRTKSGAAGLLFPVLAAASTEPAIASELRKTLSNRPLWGSDFIVFLSANTPDPGATAALFTSLRRSGVDIPQSASGAVVGKLIDAGRLDAAWSYYVTLRQGVNRQRSRDPEFTAGLKYPSDLDWIALRSDTGLSSSIQRGAQSGLFDFYAPPGVGGPLLRQAQLLPAGRYRLEGKSAGVEQPGRSRPYWVLTCKSDGRELGRVELPSSSTQGGRFAGSFTVPTDCPAQLLTLFARGSDELGGLAGQIERVELRPAE